MHRLLPLFVLLSLFALQRPVDAQDDKLSADQAAWLQSVISAGWSGSSNANGVSITARSVNVWSEHLKPVLANEAALTEAQRAALDDLVRIDITEPGWLDHYPVSPGRYSIGLRQGSNNMQLVTFDPEGKLVDVDGAYMNTPTDDEPHTTASASGGAANVAVFWGGIKLSWKFVSSEEHDSTLGTLTERKSGRVSIFSDLPEEAHIQKTADLCNKAVAANETLTGGKLPAGFRYELYLVAQVDTYAAIDELLTGGNFSRNGAFTGWLTARSYVRYYTHFGEDYALPSSLLEVIIHELHHQFVYHAFPAMRYAADWWQESMAELAAQRGLELADKTAAENYRKRRMSELMFYTRAGRLPSAEDILSDSGDHDIGGFYTAMWTLGQALSAQAKDVSAMWAAAAQHELGSGQDQVLRRELDVRFASVPRLFDTARAKTARDGEWYVKWNATVDERDRVLEVNTEVGEGGFAALNQPVPGNSVTLSGEFRWDNQPAPQADFVFAYAAGATATRFMKLALMRDQAMLFSYDDGNWKTLGTVDYKTKLDVMKDNKPIWHTFTLSYDAKTGLVRLDTTDGRWAEFTVKTYTPCKDTLGGVGTYDSVAWFKNVMVK